MSRTRAARKPVARSAALLSRWTRTLRTDLRTRLRDAEAGLPGKIGAVRVWSCN